MCFLTVSFVFTETKSRYFIHDNLENIRKNAMKNFEANMKFITLASKCVTIFACLFTNFTQFGFAHISF